MTAEPSVPELGPLLGRLVRAGDPAAGASLSEDTRLHLLDGLFQRAAEARRLAREGKPAEARAALDRAAWVALFHDLARGVSSRCLENVERDLRKAAQTSRLPPARLAGHLPSEDDRRVLRNQSESAGQPLERIPDPAEAEPWEEGLLRAAIALEESWERLVAVLRNEEARWSGEIARVASWSRPTAPLYALTAVVFIVALGLGLSIGGYLPAPGILGGIRNWWWSLPWP